MPTCSIIIRSFNEERHIGRLLAGILAQSVRDVEILVVDSGSTDATLSIASRFPVRSISIDPAEFTFGRSLNRGCSEASGDFLVLASAHVYPVYPDWLERLLAPFHDPQVALAYGRQRGHTGSRYSERQIFAKWYPAHSIARQDHPFCNNANAAVRRKLWQARGYDETLSGLEDLDWAAHVMEEGWHIAYAAEAEVVHVHEETPRAVYNRFRREAMALRRIRPDQTMTSQDAIGLYLRNAFQDLRHAAHEQVLLREAWGILWFRFMQFYGSYRGSTMAGELTSKLKEAFYYPRGFDRAPAATARSLAPIHYESPDEKSYSGKGSE